MVAKKAKPAPAKKAKKPASTWVDEALDQTTQDVINAANAVNAAAQHKLETAAAYNLADAAYQAALTAYSANGTDANAQALLIAAANRETARAADEAASQALEDAWAALRAAIAALETATGAGAG